MTQEQDIVERLLKCEKFFISDYGYNHAATCAEARQIIAALRAERDEVRKPDFMLLEERDNLRALFRDERDRAEAAEARVKELERKLAFRNSCWQDAIRERDDARMSLHKYGDHLMNCRYRGGHDCSCGLDDRRRARTASSNREGGEE